MSDSNGYGIRPYRLHLKEDMEGIGKKGDLAGYRFDCFPVGRPDETKSFYRNVADGTALMERLENKKPPKSAHRREVREVLIWQN